MKVIMVHNAPTHLRGTVGRHARFIPAPAGNRILRDNLR